MSGSDIYSEEWYWQDLQKYRDINWWGIIDSFKYHKILNYVVDDVGELYSGSYRSNLRIGIHIHSLSAINIRVSIRTLQRMMRGLLSMYYQISTIDYIVSII